MTSATTTTTGIDVTEEEKTEAAVEQQPQKVDEEEIKEGLALAEGGESSSANVVEAAQGKPISEIDGAVIAVPDGDDDDDESRKRKAIEDPDNAANKKNEDATTAADQSPNDQLPRTQDADTAAESNIYKRARTLPTRVAWEDRLASLRAYKTEHGHLNIPIRYKANPSLGKFVHNTREQFKLYHHQCKPGYQKRCSLTPERVVELDAIGFIWTTERVKRQNEDWAGRLEQLKEYKDQHGVRP